MAAAPLYAAAHNSLMRRVAEARASYFAASQGAFGGLYRRVRGRAIGEVQSRET